MRLEHKSFGTAIVPLASKRQVRARISTSQPDRVGDVVDQAGVDFRNFLASGAVLWNHDQDEPIASCLSLALMAGGLEALVQFPAPGGNGTADRVYHDITAGIVKSTSIGFIALDEVPIVPGQPKKGMRVRRSELLEFSFVSVPANPGATIQERRFSGSSKAGRVLSGTNASRLREAHDHMESARDLVAGILDDAGEDFDASPAAKRTPAEQARHKRLLDVIKMPGNSPAIISKGIAKLMRDARTMEAQQRLRQLEAMLIRGSTYR